MTDTLLTIITLSIVLIAIAQVISLYLYSKPIAVDLPPDDDDDMFPGSHLTTGNQYFIRTATYHAVGRLISISENEFVLDNASWVAQSGRWSEALSTGKLMHVEPFVEPVIIFRANCIDATEWNHPLPTEAK